MREADEEIALKPGQVEILGELGPAQRSLSGLRVWPYVVRTSALRRRKNSLLMY